MSESEARQPHTTEGVNRSELNISISPLAKHVLDSLTMFIAEPGQPIEKYQSIHLHFGMLLGVLSDIITSVHAADPKAFVDNQPSMCHAISQLQFIASAHDPRIVRSILMATGYARALQLKDEADRNIPQA